MEEEERDVRIAFEHEDSNQFYVVLLSIAASIEKMAEKTV